MMSEVSAPTEVVETWYGWNAKELKRAGLLYLYKGVSVVIIGILFILFYPSNEKWVVSIIFLVFGAVELLLGQWFFRQSRSMARR